MTRAKRAFGHTQLGASGYAPMSVELELDKKLCAALVVPSCRSAIGLLDASGRWAGKNSPKRMDDLVGSAGYFL